MFTLNVHRLACSLIHRIKFPESPTVLPILRQVHDLADAVDMGSCDALRQVAQLE